MHIFHSRENIKTCIFTAVKIQDLIFSRETETVRLELLFSIFSIWSKGSNSLWHICFFSKGNNYLWQCKQKKERAFINSSATTRKLKTNANVKLDSLLFILKDYGIFVDNKKKIQMFLLNMSFISLVKWTIIIFHSWLHHS